MKIGKFEKTNTSPLIKNGLLTLKGLSLSPTLFKVLLQNPPNPPPTPPEEDFQSNTIWAGTFVPPFMQEASMRLSGQAQNARRRKKKMNCLTHTTKCQKGNTIWQPDKWPIIHLLFHFLWIFFFFSFCCLHNETPCIGWEIQKKESSGKWWHRMCKLKRLQPKLHASISSRCMVPPEPQPPPLHPPLPHLQRHANQGPDRNHSRMPACRHTLPLRSLSPEPLFISDWPIIGDTMWWCDIYALSGWSLFTCQSIRASCCGRSDSHEASTSEWTHDRQS